MPIITTPGQTTPPTSVPNNVPSTPSRIQTVISTNNPPVVAVPKPTITKPIVQPTVNKPVPVVQPVVDDSIGEDDDYEKVPENDESAKSLALSRLTEEVRRKAITNAFSTVLGREPTDRDFSYYRFSTLTEETLTRNLLNLPEHKKMVEKAREHATLKQNVADLDMQVKQSISRMQSMQQELATMQQLLIEKNRYIQQMRGIPEDRQQPMVQIPQQQQEIAPEVHTVPTEQVAPAPSVEFKKLPGPMDELKSMFGGLFGKKK